MDVVLVLPFVPKLALTLLIITGILIVIEVYNIIKEGKPQKPAPAATPTNAMEPVMFSDQPPPAPLSPPLPPKRIKFIIPLIAVALVSAVVIIVSIAKRSSETAEQPPEQPMASSSATVSPPIIKLYTIDKNKKWLQLSADALTKLNAGDEIKIAVATEKTYTKALFNVNNEELLYVKDQQLNPFKEGFITYTIREGITNYTIEVFLLE